jgi:DNA-binding transcriptional regulator YiaG
LQADDLTAESGHYLLENLLVAGRAVVIQDHIMAERLWCQRCNRYPEGVTTMDVSRTFDGHVFKAKLGARRCLKCHQKFLMQDADADFDRRIALRLALSWPPSPATLSLMRKVIGLSAKDLAALLGITRETVSRWEHGRLTPGRQTIALLAELADSGPNGRARKTLETLKNPRPLAAVILINQR